MGSLLFFPIEVTVDEAAFGFALHSSPDGRCAVAAVLTPGLFAVKTRTRDGHVEYRVCDSSLEQIYAAASTLTELHERFLARILRSS